MILISLAAIGFALGFWDNMDNEIITISHERIQGGDISPDKDSG